VVDSFRALNISLESVEPEIYRSIRIGATFERWLANVRRLAEL